MKPKLNFVVSVLTALLFVASFASGKMAEESRSFREIHESVSGILLLFVLLHLIGYRKVFLAQAKNFFRK